MDPNLPDKITQRNIKRKKKRKRKKQVQLCIFMFPTIVDLEEETETLTGTSTLLKHQPTRLNDYYAKRLLKKKEKKKKRQMSNTAWSKTLSGFFQTLNSSNAFELFLLMWQGCLTVDRSGAKALQQTLQCVNRKWVISLRIWISICVLRLFFPEFCERLQFEPPNQIISMRL